VPSDFDIVDSNRSPHGFYSSDESVEEVVKNSSINLQCIIDDYSISGDFNSNSASNLMVVFELCDSSVRFCKSKEDIDKALTQSYLLMIENSETYKQQNTPTSGKMILRQAHVSWHAISKILPIDFHRNIQVEDVKYNYYNYGLGLYRELETIFKIIESPNRVLPYLRPFQIAVTFEIDSTKYELIRLEFSLFDWLSAIGGLSSIILGASTIISALESPQRYVTSALIADKPSSLTDIDAKNQKSKNRAYNQDEIKTNCLPGLKANAAMRKWVP